MLPKKSVNKKVFRIEPIEKVFPSHHGLQRAVADKQKACRTHGNNPGMISVSFQTYVDMLRLC